MSLLVAVVVRGKGLNRSYHAVGLSLISCPACRLEGKPTDQHNLEVQAPTRIFPKANQGTPAWISTLIFLNLCPRSAHCSNKTGGKRYLRTRRYHRGGERCSTRSCSAPALSGRSRTS